MRHLFGSVLLVIGALATVAEGALQLFDDKAEWEGAVSELGTFSTIGFADLPVGQISGDEYFDRFGVLFTDAFNQIDFGCEIFPNDCFGLDGFGDIDMLFSTPKQWIAVDYPGGIGFELYQGDTLVGATGQFDFPIGGTGFFGGLISDTPFDRVVLFDPIGFAAEIDDLHFGGPAVPAPGALGAVLALPLLMRRRRDS